MNAALEKAREHFFQGVEHFEADRFAQARESFEASLALAPGRASVLANLGITLVRMGEPGDAIPVLEHAAAADPGHWDAWAYLGLAHEALGQWREALVALDRAVGLHADNAAPWMALGRCRARLGAQEPALHAFDHAVELDPGLAQAWSERGNLLREMHRLDEAARCFEQAIALGADDELHRYYLASVSGDGPVPAPPREYAESLFDSYANEFSEHLVEQLKYSAHDTLLRPLVEQGRRYRSVLDLGCGTGLCGSIIAPQADAIDGVDVSRGMLEQAERLGVYRELVHADLVSYLAESQSRADLVLAADVFIYVGELSGVFRSVRRILEPGGCFAMTFEVPEDAHELVLLPSLRYAHSESYLRRLADENGFRVRDMFTAPLRHDQLRPIDGLYVYLE